MSKRLFVGNMSYETRAEGLAEAFGVEPSAVTIPMNQDGRVKGFGFVDVPDEKMDSIMQEWNGKELDGRAIVVNEARPREDRPRTGGYNDNRGSGGNRNSWGR